MVSSSSLFDAGVLGAAVRGAVPAGHVLRPLELTDYRKGYTECLANLTVVGEVTEQMFADSFEEMRRAGGYFVVVVEDLGAQRVVATGTLVVEQKFLRGCGRVGHIEDIVVAKGQEGKGLGKTIIASLLAVAESVGCYKSILDCDESNVRFYEKCGLVRKGVQMALYMPGASKY
ncbi:Glucosamine-phosphate N-acetyltransferase-like protein [Coemansia javaensis]|uniref:Glucosamine 6-phosphate N-acetyltransferase n=1 Tax=Coemansia javaensis TaxID=2761396 RepID=A0A9W8H4F1_9FUNG|nr:Glucosamine-phosphate N-acetyltransferase-like protein [Coemansia javaensis]